MITAHRSPFTVSTEGLRSKIRAAKARHSSAFTLLEIVLALSILAGGLAIISEAARIAQNNARVARDLTYAQMLCEAKMNELATGILALDGTSGVPFDGPYDGWAYSVDVGETDIAGLRAVTVTVYQDPAPKFWPVEYSLVRWIGDLPPPVGSVGGDSSNGASASSQNSSNASGSNGTSASGTPSGNSSGGTGS